MFQWKIELDFKTNIYFVHSISSECIFLILYCFQKFLNFVTLKQCVIVSDNHCAPSSVNISFFFSRRTGSQNIAFGFAKSHHWWREYWFPEMVGRVVFEQSLGWTGSFEILAETPIGVYLGQFGKKKHTICPKLGALWC